MGKDSASKLRKYQTKHGARLMLLRRTLRRNPSLASLVVTLHVPDPIIPLYLANGNPNPEYDEYISLLASVIMCCPNLEAFTGFQPFYNHTFDRLTHALSTRLKLKQHVWILSENDEVSERSKKQLAPGLLDQHQVYEFRQYHRYWKNTETLLLCSPASLGVLEHRIFIKILHDLPLLRNLCVSSFDADDFDDATLVELPKLACLRLEECHGVTDVGLARWASNPSSLRIKSLSLIHQNIRSLATISKLFSGLDSLQRFTLMQTDVIPSLPVDMVVFPPLFASRSVQYIHWDIAEDTTPGKSLANLETNIKNLDTYEHVTTNTHLALSVLHHGFPALTTLRAPRDTSPPGVLQSVCRPAKDGNVLLPTDLDSTSKIHVSRTSNSLQAARLRAQKLIDESVNGSRDFVKMPMTYYSPPLGSRQQSNVSYSSTSTAATAPSNSTQSLSTQSTTRPPRGPSHRKPVPSQHPSNFTLSPPSRSTTSLPQSTLSPLSLNSTTSLPPSTTSLTYKPHPHPALSPLKISSFSLPTQLGRISISLSSSGHIFLPPVFSLDPSMKYDGTKSEGMKYEGRDYEGRDANGGLATWGELLRVKERTAKMQTKPVKDDDWEEGVRDGCVGAWNRGRGDAWIQRKMGTGMGTGKGSERWRHEERERWRRGREVLVEDFF